VRLLITAKGPSLAAFGVTGTLADPTLTVYDSAGRAIATNDNVGTVAAGSELSTIAGVPTNASESALLLILPPGNYSAVVAGVGGTSGIALLEATDIRSPATVNAGASATVASIDAQLKNAAALLAEFRADLRLAVVNPRLAAKAAGPGALELCAGVPLTGPLVVASLRR